MNTCLRLLIVVWTTLLPPTLPSAKADEPDTCMPALLEAARQQNKGNFSKAVAVATQALQGPCAKLPPDDPSPGFALQTIGTAKMALRDFAGAEAALTAGLANLEKTLGAKHDLVAGTLNDLGALYGRMGRYKKAREVLLRAITVYQNLADKKFNSGLAMSYNNLANVDYALGNATSAEEYQRKSIAIRAPLLGPANRDTLLSRISLGDILLDQGRCKAAKQEFAATLGISERTFGSNDSLVVKALNGLGRAELSLGQLKEGEATLARSLQLAEKAKPVDPQLLGSALNSLGGIKYRQMQYADAEALYLRALSLLEQHHGAEHPELLSVLTNLAEDNTKMGNSGRAALFRDRVQAIRSKSN